jgi:hypothetical protein
MEMRETYVVCGLPRLTTRRERGDVLGEARLETREGRGEGMLDGLVKHLETAMRQPSGRQDQRLLVDLRAHGVIHLRVTMPHHRAVVLDVLGVGAEVLRERGLRLREIGLLKPHLVVYLEVRNLLVGS